MIDRGCCDAVVLNCHLVWVFDDEGLQNHVVLLENYRFFVALPKTHRLLQSARGCAFFLFVFQDDSLLVERVDCGAWVSNLDDMIAVWPCACLLETCDGFLGVSVSCDAIARLIYRFKLVSLASLDYDHMTCWDLFVNWISILICNLRQLASVANAFSPATPLLSKSALALERLWRRRVSYRQIW